MQNKAVNAVILHPGALQSMDRGSGIRTIPLVTAARGSTSILNGITTLEPGAAVPLHFHNCEESVIVLAGLGCVHIDGADADVAAGDTTLIPAGVPHYFRNRSDRESLSIFWTYASLNATRTIVATGVTTRIEQEHRSS